MAGTSSSSKHLIIVAVPDDSYYRESLADIQEFARKLAEGTHGLDDLLVLYPRSLKKETRLPFGDKALHLVVEESPDLWIRDYGLVTPGGQIKFSYRPKYLKSKDVKYVEMEFTKLLGKLGISVKKSDIVLDGGNVVDNNKNKVIISERILLENKGKSQAALKGELENLFNSKVVFIPDPIEDTTGHSDGLVSFIEDDVLLISDYQDLEFYNSIEMAVKSEFPDLKIVKLPCGVHDGHLSDKKWKGFCSATGYYVNALVTNNAVYVPQFGSPVDDARAIEIIKANTSKAVVPIDTSQLSHMGGSVRCTTWQIESSHSIAQILYKHCKSDS